MTQPLAHARIEIATSPASAYAYAANLENYPHWFPGVLHMRALDDLPPTTPGKRYEETLPLPGGRHQWVCVRVVEADAPVRLTTEGDLPWLRPRMTIECRAAAGAGTVLSWRMETRREAPALRWVLPLLRLLLARRAKRGLSRLKEQLEQDQHCDRGHHPQGAGATAPGAGL